MTMKNLITPTNHQYGHAFGHGSTTSGPTSNTFTSTCNSSFNYLNFATAPIEQGRVKTTSSSTLASTIVSSSTSQSASIQEHASNNKIHVYQKTVACDDYSNGSQKHHSPPSSTNRQQPFIVDYMFRDNNSAIKKSKKIKRKYEFKKNQHSSKNSERPEHVKMYYIFADKQEIKECSSSDKQQDLLEKQLNENMAIFNYSKDDHVSILSIDSSIKRKRTVDNISTNEMISILHLTQQQACNLLGCSLSTIKRKFYSIRNELGIEKWPHNYLEFKEYPFFDNFYPMSLKFILNDENENYSNSDPPN